MRAFIALVVALVLSDPALADGVDLTFLPAPALTQTERQSLAGIQGRTDAASVVVTGMNAAAIDSPIINITIDGVVYRLVGAKTNRADLPNVDLWDGSNGTGPGAMTANFARLNGILRGRVYVAQKMYEILQISTSKGATVQIRVQLLRS